MKEDIFIAFKNKSARMELETFECSVMRPSSM